LHHAWGARITTTQWLVAEHRATPAAPSRPALAAGLLTTVVLVFLGAALVTAAPAAAIDDSTRPEARVTHGPSCRPGGLVVEVVAGTSPYAVRLATTRTPAGEDAAVLQPGETVILRSEDVAHGETIDGRLEYAARDGSGTAYTDELEEYSFTRPTREDCAAVAAPTTPEPSPPTTSSSPTAPSSPTTSSPTPEPTSPPSGSSGQVPTPGTPSTSPTPTEAPRPSGSAAPGPADRGSEPPARPVSAGDTVTLQATGFLPGERVTIQFHQGGEVLGTATAGPDGMVEADIRIPGRTAAGRTTVAFVGNDSAVVADVHLQVAGAERAVAGSGWAELVPLTAAAVALVGSVAGLVSVAGAQRTAGRRSARTGSA
jgi:hypothetical protein